MDNIKNTILNNSFSMVLYMKALNLNIINDSYIVQYIKKYSLTWRKYNNIGNFLWNKYPKKTLNLATNINSCLEVAT